MVVKYKKRKGTRNERKSIRWYEKKGFICQRAAGSLGVFDFIAFGTNCEGVHLVQVKSNRKPSLSEMTDIRKFPTLFICDGEGECNCKSYSVKRIHIWHDYEREPEVIEVI